MIARSFKQRQVLAIAHNAHIDRAGSSTPIWEAKEKDAARKLERAGLVTIERTTTRFAGHLEWRVTLTPAGLVAVAS